MHPSLTPWTPAACHLSCSGPNRIVSLTGQLKPDFPSKRWIPVTENIARHWSDKGTTEMATHQPSLLAPWNATFPGQSQKGLERVMEQLLAIQRNPDTFLWKPISWWVPTKRLIKRGEGSWNEGDPRAAFESQVFSK